MFFNKEDRICEPFYYGNCKPGQAPSTSSNEQQNMFDSQDECEQICPNTYPPVIEIEKKVSYYPGNIQHFISWAKIINGL